jgi:hypothetical protein
MTHFEISKFLDLRVEVPAISMTCRSRETRKLTHFACGAENGEDVEVEDSRERGERDDLQVEEAGRRASGGAREMRGVSAWMKR